MATQTANHAPVLTGRAAASVDMDSQYEFLPVASDADGDRLMFSISGKPDWASFDTATGRLSGTPVAGQAGTYANIVVTVSDGRATTSLPPFEIQVTGGATLSWSAPMQNMDGSVLRDLVGYRVYVGTSAGTLVLADSITDPMQHSFRVGGLAPGTWYFAVTAYNAAGIESDFSNLGSKTIS